MEKANNEQLLVDQEFINSLASPNLQVRWAAAENLPEALSRRTLADLHLRVDMLSDEGPQYGRHISGNALLYHLGSSAAWHGDLVTAENVKRELLVKASLGKWLRMRRHIRKVESKIIDEMMGLE